MQLLLITGILSLLSNSKSPLITIKSNALLTTLKALGKVWNGLSIDPSPVSSLPSADTYQSPSSQLRTVNNISSTPNSSPLLLNASKRKTLTFSWSNTL